MAGGRPAPAGAAAANDDDRVAWAVAHAAVQAAEDLGVAAILCPTQSGTTARRVAAFRPSVPIVGISVSSTRSAGSASCGVCDRSRSTPAKSGQAQIDAALAAATDAGIVRAGKLVAVVSASQGKRAGSTDTVRIVRDPSDPA